jgi:enoyl-CoA hydratase
MPDPSPDPNPDTVRLDVADGIATVTLDRPPVNAIDRPTMARLATVFGSLRDRRDVRVAIFTATGDRAFIAGVDLKTFEPGGSGERAKDPDFPASRLIDPGLPARDAMWSIKDCAVPVIAAVNGPAIGAGLALVACCDIIVAVEGATFGTTEINVGLLGASAHLSRLVGRYKAREMFFTGELVTAEELQRLGAIRSVVPRDKLAATAHELATTLAAKSPLALRMAKDSMNRVEDLPLEEAYRIEQDYTDRLLRFEDAAEARRAFFEKREPDWRWR